MSCPLEKFARVVGKCPVCLAEHEAGPSSLPGLIADWAEDDRPAPPDGVVSLPAPKPDELTVDDVLGVLDGMLYCIGHGWVHGEGEEGWQLERSILDTCHKVYDVDGNELTRGTLREVLTEAKGRGMLG